MENSPNLLCKEDHKSCLNHCMRTQFINFDPAIEQDYINFLIQGERDTDFGSVSSSGLVHARFDAISWTLNTQTLLGVRIQTAYLSLNYFDRVLSLYPIGEVKPWVFKILSIACLSLAVKMEESISLPLSVFLTNKGYDGFSPHLIHKMEIFVLGVLGWNMRLITPFHYLYYLSNKFGVQETKLDQVISRAMELVMAIIKEIRLMDYRPSMIAAGAVLAAGNWQLTQEAFKCKVSTLSLWNLETSEIDQLFACYNLMQRLSGYGNPSTPNTSSVVAHTVLSPTKRSLAFGNDEDSSSDIEKMKIQRRL